MTYLAWIWFALAVWKIVDVVVLKCKPNKFDQVWHIVSLILFGLNNMK